MPFSGMKEGRFLLPRFRVTGILKVSSGSAISDSESETRSGVFSASTDTSGIFATISNYSETIDDSIFNYGLVSCCSSIIGT